MPTKNEKECIVVICPWCGKAVDTPYVYDGTFEIHHWSLSPRYGKTPSTMQDHGCEKDFFVAILEGRLHVYKKKEDLDKILTKFFNK